jgi:hypothetical protein
VASPSISLPPLSLGTTSLLTVPPPSFGSGSFPPVPLAKQSESPAQATANALIARVLPTQAQHQPQVPSALSSQAVAPPQGTMDSFTAQYAPETYKIALEGTLAPSVVASAALKEPTSSAQGVAPTYAGTNIPYFDHEIQKIQAAEQGNATLTPPLPTFATQSTQSDPPPAPAAPATQAAAPPVAQTQPSAPAPPAPASAAAPSSAPASPAPQAPAATTAGK